MHVHKYRATNLFCRMLRKKNDILIIFLSADLYFCCYSCHFRLFPLTLLSRKHGHNGQFYLHDQQKQCIIEPQLSRSRMTQNVYENVRLAFEIKNCCFKIVEIWWVSIYLLNIYDNC